jgi:hypothetical protein
MALEPSMTARLAAISMASLTMLICGPAWSEEPPPQQLAIITLASTGCILLQSSKQYSAAADPAKIAISVQSACDKESVDLFKFTAAHPEFARSQFTLEQTRAAGRQMAQMMIMQIRDATVPRQPKQ